MYVRVVGGAGVTTGLAAVGGGIWKFMVANGLFADGGGSACACMLGTEVVVGGAETCDAFDAFDATETFEGNDPWTAAGIDIVSNDPGGCELAEDGGKVD